MDGVARSGYKARLLGFFRSLAHQCCRRIGIKYPIRDLAQDSGGYFSALHNVHNLALRNLRVEHISEDQFRICFSAFRKTLTDLSLRTIATSLGAFVTLVDYFPNITTLQLRSFVLEPDLEFFDRFAKLDLEYEGSPYDPFMYEKRMFLESAFI